MKWLKLLYKIIVIILLLLIYNEVITIRTDKAEAEIIEFLDPSNIKEKPQIFHEAIP